MRPNNNLASPSRIRLLNVPAMLRLNRRALATLLLVAALILQMLPALVPGVMPTASADTGAGSVLLSSLETAFTENFNTLAIAGTTNSTLPTGWYITESGGGTRDNEQYGADTGGSNTGDTYSYGAASTTERALGGLRSGTLIPVFGASFTNNTGSNITSLTISYTGEQWRQGVTNRGASDRIDFQISTNATDLTTGTYNNADALDFLSPNVTATAGSLVGNDPGNRTAINATISGLSIGSGATFFIRWTDFDIASSDDGLAVDDFSITAHSDPGDVAPEVSATVPAAGATNVALNSNISITFSEAVSVGASWFQINCATSGLRQVGDTTVSGGPITFTIDPSAPFAFSEQCTVTVFASQVTDQDVTDPPDNMDADASFSFQTVVPTPTGVVISQLYGGGGNSGATLTHDFIELYNRTAAPINMNGWSVQYQSAAGAGTWQVTNINGMLQPGQYYLVQEAAGTGGTTPLPTPDASGTIAMSATAGKVALVANTTALVGSCPGGAIVDLVGYGAAATCFEGAAPTAAPSNTTAALRKRGGCFDSDNNNIDFSIGSPNPRNTSDFRSCGFIAAAIHDIQGSGLVTPYLGQDVVTTGIVTAKKSNGFFLQTTAVDSDPATSEGIFVFTSSAPAVAVGDAVTTQGTASEFFNLTQVESSLPGDVMVTSSGNSLPAPVTITTTILDPTGSFTQLERYEGMLMHADTLVSVAPTNEFGEISTVLPGVARPLREPGIEASQPVPPDPSSGLPDCCIPIWDLNRERILIDTEGIAGTSVISVTSNVTLSNITGPLDFTFSEYKILPTSPPTKSANISAVPVPVPTAAEFTVAGYNIENFSGGDPQLTKAALAIRNVMHSPDIIGHIEILNLASLQALATKVNQQTIAAGGADPMYQAYLIPAPNPTNTQNLGFLVKTSRVQVNGVTQEQAAATFINPVNMMSETLHDRPPLVLRATVSPGTDDEVPVIVIVNHPRSFIDIELVSGEGVRVRAKRTAQAEAIASLLQQLQTDNPTTPVIAIGDYNAYQFNDGYTDPIAILKGSPTADDQIVVDASPDLVEPNFSNLTDILPADQRYSFIFEGTPQALDHVLVNTVAQRLVTRYAVARNNADFPEGELFASDITRPERNSDHDVPVAYFAKAASTTSVSDVTATYSSSDQSVLLTANVTAPNGTVNEGTVTFSVTDAGNTVIGTPVVGTVSNGVATASYTLPGGTSPQALTITGNFSGGILTLPSSDTATLNVTYGICLLYDPTKAVKSGGTYPIKLQLCELDGSNASSAGITVTAVGVSLTSTSVMGEVVAAGDANPDNNFRFDASIGTDGGYVYNLKTTGLTTGTYNLYFTAGTDPLQHAVQFKVK